MLLFATTMSALLGGAASAVARGSVAAVLQSDAEIESFVQVGNDPVSSSSKSYTFSFLADEDLTVDSVVYDRRLLVPRQLLKSTSFTWTSDFITSLGSFFPITKDTTSVTPGTFLLSQYTSPIQAAQFQTLADGGTRQYRSGVNDTVIPGEPSSVVRVKTTTTKSVSVDSTFNIDLQNVQVHLPNESVYFIKRSTAATPRVDYDTPFPQDCSERFYYNYIPQATCNDTMLLLDPYPFFPQVDSRNLTNQVQACETLCSSNTECYAYSLQASLDAKGLPLLSSVKCRLCNAQVFNSESFTYQVAKFPNNQASSSGISVSAGDVYTINSIMGLKFYQDYTTNNTGVVHRPCNDEVVCGVVNNGFAPGETCGGEAVYEVKTLEFELGPQDGTNGLYMTACMQHLYEEHIKNGREDLRCAATKLEYDTLRAGSKLSCRFYNHTLRAGIGPNLYSASIITEPFCQIPIEQSSLHERTTSFVADCRDRSVAYSRIGEDLIDFDCSTIKLPGDFIEDGDLTCDSYIWESPTALEQFKGNLDDLKDSFADEIVHMWCPTHCAHITNCTANPHLFG